MTDATDLAKWLRNLREFHPLPRGILDIVEAADLLESQAVRIAELERENHTLRTFDAPPIELSLEQAAVLDDIVAKKLATPRGNLEKLPEDGPEKISELQAEVERLKAPCLPDNNPEQQDGKYPSTVNDILHLLSCYWADVVPDELIPADDRFAAWERQSRPVVERIVAQLAAAQAEVERLKSRVGELERERDEALLLVEGPGTLRELANEYGRALMSEAELLARERLLARAVMSLVKHDCVNPSDYVPEVMAARAVLAPGEGTPDDERPKNTRLTP